MQVHSGKYKKLHKLVWKLLTIYFQRQLEHTVVLNRKIKMYKQITVKDLVVVSVIASTIFVGCYATTLWVGDVIARITY